MVEPLLVLSFPHPFHRLFEPCTDSYYSTNGYVHDHGDSSDCEKGFLAFRRRVEDHHCELPAAYSEGDHAGGQVQGCADWEDEL